VVCSILLKWSSGVSEKRHFSRSSAG
jgi:hypothetical protein